MSENIELAAMQKIVAAIEALDEAARSRVLTWVVHKYPTDTPRVKPNVAPRDRSQKRQGSTRTLETATEEQIQSVVNLVHSCDETEQIFKEILDKNNQLDRVLLPLYIVHAHLHDAFALSASDVSIVCSRFSIRIAPENVYKVIRGKRGARMVMTVSSSPPKTFKLSRAGFLYVRQLLGTENNGVESARS